MNDVMVSFMSQQKQLSDDTVSTQGFNFSAVTSKMCSHAGGLKIREWKMTA